MQACLLAGGLVLVDGSGSCGQGAWCIASWWPCITSSLQEQQLAVQYSPDKQQGQACRVRCAAVSCCCCLSHVCQSCRCHMHTTGLLLLNQHSPSNLLPTATRYIITHQGRAIAYGQQQQQQPLHPGLIKKLRCCAFVCSHHERRHCHLIQGDTDSVQGICEGAVAL